MFDRAEITVKAGNGGDGVVSFRKEKYVPFGGPDGGDGGDGGDVVVIAERNLASLRQFKRRGFYRAGNGENGRGKKKYGRKGRDLILTVPAGTVVLPSVQVGGDAIIADLEETGQQAVVVKGGKGGRGNIHFAAPTNQAPQISERGEVGEELSVILELRLIADVGVIGYPNVGKSSLLAAASAAKPKIASYPFTTLEPILGLVEVDQKSFVLAEIPGLIDDAHRGKGLGHDFLRHVTRTKMLIHLVDGSSASLVEDMVRVNTELSLYDSALSKKPQLLVVNKIDLPQVQARLAEIKDAFRAVGTAPFFISAVTGEGVPQLMAEVMKMVSQVTVERRAEKKVARKVFRPQPRAAGASVHKEGDTFVIVAPQLERIVAGTDIPSHEVLWQIRRQLIRMGVSKALEKAGVEPGDKVRCGNLEWEW
ncbi:GTPase Obg [subsurface metagenome]